MDLVCDPQTSLRYSQSNRFEWEINKLGDYSSYVRPSCWPKWRKKTHLHTLLRLTFGNDFQFKIKVKSNKPWLKCRRFSSVFPSMCGTRHIHTKSSRDIFSWVCSPVCLQTQNGSVYLMLQSLYTIRFCQYDVNCNLNAFFIFKSRVVTILSGSELRMFLKKFRLKEFCLIIYLRNNQWLICHSFIYNWFR